MAMAQKRHGVGGVDVVEFVGGYRPPEWLVDDILQRGYVYALTAPTNHGKTAIITTLIISLAGKLRFAGRMVVPGNILVLAGENPDDFTGRLIATAQELGIDISSLTGRLRIVPRTFPLAPNLDEIHHEVLHHQREVALVVVDTSAAFFSYQDENDNVAARQHAQDLRELTTLPGHPSVLVACHPAKGATRDNLMPRGGGAFIAEIDTNLICWQEGDVTTLHHQHKIRGPGFEPIKFRLVQRPINDFSYPDGRVPHTVVAVPLNESEAAEVEEKVVQDENRLLYAMLHHPRESIAGWARLCSWKTPKGDPLKSRVHRILQTLEGDRLVKKFRGKWILTETGKHEAERID